MYILPTFVAQSIAIPLTPFCPQSSVWVCGGSIVKALSIGVPGGGTPPVVIETLSHLIYPASVSQLVYFVIFVAPFRYGPSVGNPLLAGLVCTGTELHLLRCPMRNRTETRCSRQQGVSIACCKFN